MRRMMIAVMLLAGVAANAPAAGKTPLEIAADGAALAERYGRSIVTVQYFVKKDAEGREPRFEVPYKCPNCNETHWRSDEVSSEKGIPGEFAGFLIAPDRVLMTDLKVDPEFVDRIAVVCGDETRNAAEFEVAPECGAMILRLETPFERAEPLKFTGGGAPKDPQYFYLIRESGMTVSGLVKSKATAFRHVIEPGVTFYGGNPNTLVLDGSGQPVTVALQDRIVLGEETFTSPLEWRVEPIATSRARRTARIDRIRRGVLPVYLQLEAKSKEGGRRGSRFRVIGSDDEVKNDIDAIGVVLGDGRVVVLSQLVAADTARLTHIEATLPDGKKVQLEFVGTYREEGAFAAKFADGVPAGIEPFSLDGRRPIEFFNQEFDSCYVANFGNRIQITAGTATFDGLKRIRGNVAVADFRWRTGLRPEYSNKSPALTLAADGKLIAMEVLSRIDGSSKPRDVQGAQLQALAVGTDFDPENVPRSAEDRKRTPWLGVDVQMAGADTVREMKATPYLKGYAAEHAALVTEVAPNSPAARLGILVGDILLTVKRPGSSDEEKLTADPDVLAGVNWNEVMEDSRFIEVGSSGDFMPWANLDGGVNETLAKFGVGTEVEVAWVSNGERKSGTVLLDLAPVHYSNAPRTRNKELSITVCDMTAEVRKYFKFDDQAPGVVIAKVKGGGVGAVSGLRPLELIIEVNGEGVSSAKDFQEKTRGKTDLSFTVRRLANTRIVPIKL